MKNVKSVKITRKKFVQISLIFLLVSITHCNDNNKQNEAKNIEIFTRTYGYIKYFYPGYEQEEINWDKYLYYGLNKIKYCKSDKELIDSLMSLFKPIVPSINIGKENILSISTIKYSSTDTILFWQYLGLNSSDKDYLPFRNQKVRIANNNLIDSVLFNKIQDSFHFYKFEIGEDLFLEFPNAVTKNNYEKAKSNLDYKNFSKLINSFDIRTISQQDKMLAEVIVFWNVIQHFYPYHIESNLQWNNELNSIIKEIVDYESGKYSDQFLMKLGIAIKDGHFLLQSKAYPQYFLPISCKRINNEVIVTRSFDTLYFKAGDIISAIGDFEVNWLIDSCKSIISGSDQFREYSSCAMFHGSFTADSVIVKLVRNSYPMQIKVKRVNSSTFTVERSHELNKDVCYFDLNDEENIDRILDISSKYNGIIVDLRGGNGNLLPIHKLLQHLTSDTIFPPFKFLIPRIIYPDRIGMTYDEPFQFLEPVSPQYTCKLVVLTSAWDISYIESQIKIIQLYKLGTVIGEQTGGTN